MGWGRGKWRVTVTRYGVSLGGDENVLELVVTAAQICEYA